MGGPEPRKSGAPKGGAPKGGGPNGGSPKFRAFFSLSRHSFHSFLPLFWSFRGILVVFEAPGRSNVHVWSSQAVVCEPRRPGLMEDLPTWLRSQGFPGPAPGNHLSARAQEFILIEGSSFDGRVTLLEAAYITLKLHTRRGTTAQSRPAENVERPRAQPNPRVCRGTAFFPESWAVLDEVELDNWFALRVPTLRSCPHFLRGRLRHCFAITLREQRRAKIEGNEAAEVPAWKLFRLVPMMLLHRPKHAGSIGKG